MRYMVKVERADESLIKTLVAIGALYIDETGIHAGEPGNYPNKKAPTTAKSEGAFK